MPIPTPDAPPIPRLSAVGGSVGAALNERPGVALGVAGGLAIFTAAVLVATLAQQVLEVPLVEAINALSRHAVLLDQFARMLTVNQLPQGVLLIGLLWYLWFDAADIRGRGRLVAGLAAAACAGFASRIMQLALPTHLRPLHTSLLSFQPPIGVDPQTLNHFNAFPSDHAAVFFSLAFVAWRARPLLGSVAFICAGLVDLARVYEGYHWPSDVVGALGLSLLVTSLFRAGWLRKQGDRVAAWEPAHRPSFYLLAFLVTYQVATLFDDARQIGQGLAYVVLHQDRFAAK
jgi:undecaprenyl-diphosphatase